MLRQFFLNSLAEDSENNTEFDADVVDALETLESRYEDSSETEAQPSE